VEHSSPNISCAHNPANLRAGADRVVLAWESSGQPQQWIAHLLTSCGVTPQWLDDPSRLADVAESSSCRTVLLVFDPSAAAADQRAVEMSRAFSGKGFTVVACLPGAGSMSLAVRSQLYLAGCGSLLDTAAANFQADLQRTIAGAVDTSDHGRAEVERVKAIMAEVGAVGSSPALLSVFRQLARISALSDLPTLITGETGTGKELLARALYAQDGKRRHGPFVSVNCSAISPMLAESELFGHRRGAFTGADRDRKGLIRAADGGVLFLDEIGELSGPLQAKLLRVLQEGRVLAVGDEREVPVSVRVVAATNADLRAMVEAGTFRADLFHRLNVLSLHLPPLRERRADIPPLIAHFARRHGSLNQTRLPAAPVSWHAEFVDALCQLDLPGNARQLENLVRWALVHNTTGRLELGDLPPDVWEQLARRAPAVTAPPSILPAVLPGDPVSLLATNDWNLSRSLDSCERSIIATALRVSHGNQSRAARLLGITPRSVYNKVRRHKLA
jgi:transcriptional regulator with GAF, ATPase, and Fis domain